MKKWRCLVCEHIHKGDSPPEKCPVCGSGKEEFVLMEDENKEDINLEELEELERLETDLIVVGSGAAGLTAAITGKHKGLETIVLEKGEVEGGTSARSGGRYWIPNNLEQKQVGIEDDREYGIKYMARYSFPDLYDAEKENYGLEKEDLELIETYYDTGPELLDFLEGLDVLESEMDYNWKEKPQLDYMDTYEENKEIRGRTLRPKTEKAAKVNGFDYIQLLHSWLKDNDVDLRLNHRVTNIILNSKGEAMGVRAISKDGIIEIYARKGIVFATGGFSHNKDLMRRFQYGPQYGGCASPNNEGDLVNMAEEVGIKLGNMQNAYRNQSLFEKYLENPGGVSSIFYITGDSNFQVNKYGKRVMNEKRNYNDRAKSHFQWDSLKGEWTNKLLFMVMDERNAVNWQGMSPLQPGKPEEMPYVIVGKDLDELSLNIQKRLDELKEETANFRLDESFKENLISSFERFNKFAENGVDKDFGRGSADYDLEFFTFPPTNPTGIEWPPQGTKNEAIYPLSKEGPYYAFILASGTLDTNGGPIINKDAQMIGYDGEPVRGLYGAGNCIASPGKGAYWGAGATLGSAMIFGYRAASHLAEQEDISWD